MATEGQALHSRSGVFLYSAQTTLGTAVTPATSGGIVEFTVNAQTGMRSVHTIGQAPPLFLKPGRIRTPWSITIRELQTTALIARALRSSGVVPLNTFGFGYKDDAGQRRAWQVQDCKINTLDVRGAAGAPISATIEGVGGILTELTTLDPAHLTPTPLDDYETVFLKAAGAYPVRDWRVVLNNNVTVHDVVPGAAATVLREPTYFLEGYEDVSGEITRFARSAVSMQAATIAGFAILITATDAAGGMTPNTAILNVGGAKFTEEEMSGGGEEILFRTPFMATSLAFS